MLIFELVLLVVVVLLLLVVIVVVLLVFGVHEEVVDRVHFLALLRKRHSGRRVGATVAVQAVLAPGLLRAAHAILGEDVLAAFGALGRLVAVVVLARQRRAGGRAVRLVGGTRRVLVLQELGALHRSLQLQQAHAVLRTA